jgi:hypothetical protein
VKRALLAAIAAAVLAALAGLAVTWDALLHGGDTGSDFNLTGDLT